MRRLLLIGALALAGCGGEDDASRRDAVSLYIRDANTVLQASAADFARAEQALQGFALEGPAAATSERELERAAAALRAARASLGELEPVPAEAKRLHAQLVQLVETQIALADDMARLAAHLPAAGRILGRTEGARARLQRSLEGATTAEAQAAAARTYAAAAGRDLTALRELEPPDVLEEWHAGQVGVLGTSRTLAARLADALEAGDREEISAVLTGFERLTGKATSAARAQVQAVRAFNRRVEAQRDLVEEIQAEQRRLDRELR